MSCISLEPCTNDHQQYPCGVGKGNGKKVYPGKTLKGPKWNEKSKSGLVVFSPHTCSMKMNIKGLSGLHSSLWTALFFSPLASIFWASSFVLYIFILLPLYPGVGRYGGGMWRSQK
jgi:hypothetical protein